MLATIATAAALLAGCGGGSVDDTSFTAAADEVADTGPIPPALMDGEAQAGIAVATGRQPAPAADDTKSGLDEAAEAPTPEASVPTAAAPAPAAAARSGGRVVPKPASPSPAPAPVTDVSTSEALTTTTTPKPISLSDIRLQVEATKTFSSYKWLWSAECAGQKVGAINIPETGILGFDLGDGLGKMRFGKVADPENAARKVLMFRPNANDGVISGGPRCEITYSPSFAGKLPVNQDLWFAFGVRLQDWVSTTDEQILMQWHWSNGSIALGPFLALALKGGKLTIDSKSNNNYPPSAATTTSRVHWSNGAPPVNAWSYFVVKARISPRSSDGPYLKVWRDGTQIVNYQGPLGYNYPEVAPYLKFGHYQWLAAYNTWSSAAATKTVLFRTPALIQDSAGLYTENDVRQHVRAR